MVQLTSIRCVVTDTFGFRVKGKMFNHRKPLRYHRFKPNLDPEKILEQYSREDCDQLDPKTRERTYADARKSLGRTDYVLPNLTKQELEINQLFQTELDRQRSLMARVEKIKIIVDTKPYVGTELMMNKNMSTPHDCTRHLHEFMTTRSVVAQVSSLQDDNNEGLDSKLKYWDMHKPLQDSCRIRLRHFAEDDVEEVNKIYWRSCNLILGMAIRMAFKDEIKILLHSWPKPDVRSGSFVYDVALSLNKKWAPNDAELRGFTKVLWQIKDEALPFEPLLVSAEFARQLFATNPFKLGSIDSMSQDGKVTVYRCGGLLDLSCGPMISNTSQIGRISLASVHNLESKREGGSGTFYRFQGVSVPSQLPLSSFLYNNLIVERAQVLNKANI